MTTDIKENNQFDICFSGSGILCGLEVHLNNECHIVLSAGVAIGLDGTRIKTKEIILKSYAKELSDPVREFLKSWIGDHSVQIWELHESHGENTDSLKPQFPDDLPTHDFLEDKILLLLYAPVTNLFYHLLISVSDLIKVSRLQDRLKKLATKSKAGYHTKSIFDLKKTTPEYTPEEIQQVLYPYTSLKSLYIPRFGYKSLGIVDKNQNFGTPNFQNPFLRVNTFSDIFFEYKLIIDDVILQLSQALETLHELYGDLLTHKGKKYFKKYREVLVAKWETFLEEGSHLYYIQYFYDWLCDLEKAYHELCLAISSFQLSCTCEKQNFLSGQSVSLVIIGPVLGAQSTYKPRVFRSSYLAPAGLIEEEKLQSMKFLHWRMMTMIWTFDLPFLKLDEKVLQNKFGLIPAKEFEDSSTILEKTDTDGNQKNDLQDLPLKYTPGDHPDNLLKDQAIPYYFPLDADSPYSLHRYWNQDLHKRSDYSGINSYNAVADPDSFSSHRRALFPLAFQLRDLPFLRIEGHIGKKFLTSKNKPNFRAQFINLIQKYNLSFDVLAINIHELNLNKDGTGSYFEKFIRYLCGMEHKAGLYQGQTFVVLYAGRDEQLELDECKKDKDPEVKQYTIVADFTLPYRVSLIDKKFP